MIASRTTTDLRHERASRVTITKEQCWTAAMAFPLLAAPVAWMYGAPSGHWLTTLCGLILVAVLFTCAATDLRGHRIYNWATYSAFLWAVMINLVASIGPGEPPAWVGAIGIGQSLGGAALCFLITFAGYQMSGRGAGDVKLGAVIGALLGVHGGVFAVAYSYIVAAVAIILWSAWASGPTAIVKAGLRTIGKVLGPLWPFPPTAADSALLLRPIPLGPYFAIGTLLVVLELVPTWH
ncbi:MAG: prepilin peptidase [Pirellulales bacterium]